MELETKDNEVLNIQKNLCRHHSAPIICVSGIDLQACCVECLSGLDSNENLLYLKHVNQFIKTEKYFEDQVSIVEDLSCRMSHMKKRMEELQCQQRMTELSSKVSKYFEQIHSALELRESELLSALEERLLRIRNSQKELEESYDVVNNCMDIGKNSSVSSGKDDGDQCNFVEVLKLLKHNEEKMRTLLDELEDESSIPSVTIDDSLIDALKSSVKIEENVILTEQDTPPESENEFTINDQSIWHDISNYIRNNSENITNNSEPVVTREDNLKKCLRQVKFQAKVDYDTSNNENNYIKRRVIYDVNDDSLSSSDISDNDDELDVVTSVPDLLLTEGDFVKCTVTNVRTPSEIYMRKVDNEVMFRRFLAEMIKFCSNDDLKVDFFEGEPVKNQVCAIKIVDMGWVRGQVLQIADNLADVFLIDHGKYVSCQLNQMKPLVRMFNSPCYSFCVSMSGIFPIGI